MKKIVTLCILSILSMLHLEASDWQRKAKCTGAVLVAAGTTYVVSKATAQCIVATAQTRFETERRLLNQYASYAYQWSAELDFQLKKYLKSMIVQSHNKNRNKWTVTILYELAQGTPAHVVDSHYNQFPLLQYKDDLDWYISRLKAIRFFSLYSGTAELNMLIDQLTYIKNYIISDHDYNSEEQLFTQRG